MRYVVTSCYVLYEEFLPVGPLVREGVLFNLRIPHTPYAKWLVCEYVDMDEQVGLDVNVAIYGDIGRSTRCNCVLIR